MACEIAGELLLCEMRLVGEVTCARHWGGEVLSWVGEDFSSVSKTPKTSSAY